MLGFLSATMSTSTQRYISYAEGGKHMDKIKSIFNNAVLVHWGIGGIVALLFAFAGIFFFNGILNIPVGREQTAVIVYICLACSTVFSVTITPYDAVLNAHENMFVYSLIGILDVCLKFSIALAIYYSSWDRLLFYGALMAFESWLIMSITKMYCKYRYFECKGNGIIKCANRETVIQMLKFASSNLINIATGMLSLYGASIIINHFYDTTVNAAWGISLQVEGILLALSSNMVKALNPVVTKSEGAGDRQRMINLSIVGCRMAFILYAFCGIPVIVLIKPLLSLWLKTVPDWTWIFCVIMVLATMTEQLYYVLWQALIAEGNVKRYNFVRAVTNIMPLLISFFMLKEGAMPYWVAINWLVFYVVCGGFSTLVFAKHNLSIQFSEYLTKVLFRGLKPALISFVLVFIIHLFVHFDGFVLIFCLLALYIVQLPIFFFLGFDSDERKLAIMMIRNNIKTLL